MHTSPPGILSKDTCARIGILDIIQQHLEVFRRDRLEVLTVQTPPFSP